MKRERREWECEKRLYERQFSMICRRKTTIFLIPEQEGEIGYTSEEGNIYVAFRHPLINVLPGPKKPVFRMGVFAHEALHQALTDFSYLSEVLSRHADAQEKRMVALFCNLLEDPAIEFFAPTVFGGELLDALGFMIRHVYSKAPGLEESGTPFAQLTNALIMLGDMGMLKGGFTFPEAQKTFFQIAPIFSRGIEEADARKRLDMAEKCAVLARPLWRKELEESPQNIEELIRKLLENASAEMKGSGEPPCRPDGCPKKRDIDKRREDFGKALEQASGTENAKDGSPSASATPSYGKTEEEKRGNGKRGNGDEKTDAESVLSRFRDKDENRPADVSEDLIDEIWEQLAKEQKKLDQEEREGDLDAPVLIPQAKGESNRKVTCRNIRMEAGEEENLEYADMRADVQHEIRLLTSSLKTIFRTDYDETIRATAGKYQIKRDLTHTSAKIFDRRKEPKNVSDLAIMLLIDISGSMHGAKIEAAKRTATVLAETFANLRVPCYVMGFTADTSAADVVHRHFVSWKNTKAERGSLAGIRAEANNDDGFSIRYAGMLLKRQKACHKILFVISDGAPACKRYTETNGIDDTKAAIREVQKVGTVFGLGIGYTVQGLKDIYGSSYFLEVKQLQELTGTLTRQLKRIVKKY